jgi:hypothetical protein
MMVGNSPRKAIHRQVRDDRMEKTRLLKLITR